MQSIFLLVALACVGVVAMENAMWLRDSFVTLGFLGDRPGPGPTLL
jgi:hypothetical protein